MTTPQHKNIAQRALDYALKEGCEQARTTITTANENSFEYRNTEIEKLQQNVENRLYVELFVNGRYGSLSTNQFDDPDTVQTLIKHAINSTKLLTPDTGRQLPDPSRCYTGEPEDLEVYDSAYSSLLPETKIKWLSHVNQEIYGTDSRIISISSQYTDIQSAEYMIDSNGIEQESKETNFALGCEVSLHTESDARPESYWYESAIFHDELIKEGIATKALNKALGKIGQKPISSGRYQLLLEHTHATRIFAPIIRAITGPALHQKQSFLIDKLGSSITSSLLTVHDNPHKKHTFGARLFDGEGVATTPRSIIENGVLNTFFIDTFHSLEMGIKPTISAPSILEFTLGDYSFDELAHQVENGIWVTGFNGGNTNGTTGDFSFGIEGFYIKNGQVIHPVGEMNLTGNILTLWQHLVAIGNDPHKNSSWLIPSVLFDDVFFNGL